MADLGYEPSIELVERLKERARKEKVTESAKVRQLLMAEVEEIFRAPRRIAAVNQPEVVLMIGVNGVGKTTTIAKLAHRDRMVKAVTLCAVQGGFHLIPVGGGELFRFCGYLRKCFCCYGQHGLLLLLHQAKVMSSVRARTRKGRGLCCTSQMLVWLSQPPLGAHVISPEKGCTASPQCSGIKGRS